MKKRGRFISIEGVEGSGKSTLARMLVQRLKDLGEFPVLTREPGGSSLGRLLRPLLLDARQTGLVSLAELHLFLADRAQHMEEEILPELEAEKTVICDRFTDSTVAYQGYGRGLGAERTRGLCATHERLPDLTFLLDLPVPLALERVRRRNEETGTAVTEGRFDNETLDFHARVREGYLEQARLNPQRIKILDASLAPEEVLGECLHCLEEKFGDIAGWIA